MGILLSLLLAISVKQDQAPLRAGCDPDATVVASVPAGTEVKLLYSLAGQAVPCYKVSVAVAGKTMTGYLPAESMDGLEGFDKARRDAAWIEVKATDGKPDAKSSLASEVDAAGKDPENAAQPGSLRIRASSLIAKANALMEAGRPEEALRILEPEARKGTDASVLTMAGVAAWRNEDNRQALEYWKKSLELSPDPELEKLYARVDRELKNDVSNDKLYGVRVMLRYDGVAVPADTAREMVHAVDETYAQVSAQLGCTTQERIVTIVQTWDAYRKTTQAAEWSGGLFDGRIHMPTAAGQQMDANLQQRLAHETTHACLAMLGTWPTWLHEGMAQKLSGESMPPARRARLIEAAKEAKLTSLNELNGGWAKLDSRNASLAYGIALAAVETLYDEFGYDGVRNILKNPERLPGLVQELDKRMGL